MSTDDITVSTLRQVVVSLPCVSGRNHLNRAVNEDLVAVEMLPQSEWSYPSSLVLEDRAQADDENTSKDDLVSF